MLLNSLNQSPTISIVVQWHGSWHSPSACSDLNLGPSASSIHLTMVIPRKKGREGGAPSITDPTAKKRKAESRRGYLAMVGTMEAPIWAIWAQYGRMGRTIGSVPIAGPRPEALVVLTTYTHRNKQCYLSSRNPATCPKKQEAGANTAEYSRR